MKERSVVFAMVLVTACVASCARTGPGGGALEESVGESTPGSRARGESRDAEDVFGFLLARYDEDGDGRVAPAEYDRDGGDFGRLDRDSDGLLTEADFAAAGRRVRPLPPGEARRARSVHLIAWYLQTDDDPANVLAEEVRLAHRAFDRDGDGRVGRTEFERLADDRAVFGRRPSGRWMGLLEVETTDPWERLAEGVDGDDDGFLTWAELEAFHDRNEADFDIDPGEVLAPRRSLTGRRAPDFTLPTVDGSDTVTLSGFAGERPVALIFGSYT